jgi:hypothetical protein
MPLIKKIIKIKNSDTEVIHGKKVALGKGTGKRVAKKAKVGMKELRKRQAKLLESMD